MPILQRKQKKSGRILSTTSPSNSVLTELLTAPPPRSSPTATINMLCQYQGYRHHLHNYHHPVFNENKNILMDNTAPVITVISSGMLPTTNRTTCTRTLNSHTVFSAILGVAERSPIPFGHFPKSRQYPLGKDQMVSKSF
jgi:hypothetical protein